MLELLPRYHNWQFAFLEAFQRHFQRPLDVEKWWSLYQVHFTGRDLTHTWPIQDSWEKLQQALLIPVQVHAATNQVPLGAEVTLQTVLRDWEPERQAPALEAKLRELAHLRVRVALDLAALVDEYCIVLGNYLKAGHRGSWFSRPRRSAAMERAANEAIRQLDLLDVRVNALRPVPAAVRELRMKGVSTGSAGTNLPAPQVTPRPNAPARGGAGKPRVEPDRTQSPRQRRRPGARHLQHGLGSGPALRISAGVCHLTLTGCGLCGGNRRLRGGRRPVH
jgi:hypothetical protein